MTSPGPRVSEARVVFDARSTPYAVDFDDVYHSADGGPAQAHHVFLAGNGLPQRWRGRERYAILETGFGLGINFLCAARACLADPDAPERLDFVSVERHPPRVEDLARAHAGWPEVAPLAAALRRAWPPALQGFHRIDLAQGRIVLTLLLGEVEPMLGALDAERFDACFLDGFSPRKNPQMWSPGVFAQLARLTRGDATASTWSVAAGVRAGLRDAGFVVERRPGFGHKREMLSARRAGSPAPATASDRHAIVLGAGLAGCWTAYALARRGWQVDLLERHQHPAQEASGNPVGALLPALNLADNINARLARAAFLHAARALADLPATHRIAAPTGLLQIAVTQRRRSRAAQADRMQAIIERHAFPSNFVCWSEPSEGARRAGRPVGGPGWWFADGGWVRPDRLCAWLLEAGGERIRARFGCEAGLFRSNGAWHASDSTGRSVARAPVTIVATAHAALSLHLPGLPRLVAVRGQVSYLPADAVRALDCVVCGDGYAAPLPGGALCVGATFEPGSTALELRAADHAENLDRAERMLPGSAAGCSPSALTGRVALRTATADRLPACGPLDLPGQPGLYLFAGLGARGLAWAPLCADVLASHLDGNPNPVAADLVHAMRPTRDAMQDTI